MAAGAKGVYVPRVTYEWYRSGPGVNATVSSHTIWEAHLRNAAFHKRFGNWPILVEGFLDYVISEHSQACVRSVARNCLPKVFPIPTGCWGRYLRALLINYLPVNMVGAIKRVKADT